MNSFNRTLFAFVALFLSFPLFAEVEIEGVFYRIDENKNEAYVTFKGETHRSEENEYVGTVVIPNKIWFKKDSISVVGIDSLAFSQCEKIISLWIPETVSKIALSAFNGCSSLRKIFVDKNNPHFFSDKYGILHSYSPVVLLKAPEMVVDNVEVSAMVDFIAPYAFNKCRKLEKIVLYNIDFIAEGVFQSCSKLRNIISYSELKHIGNRAFYACSNLKTLLMTDSLITIGNEAFYGCSSLQNFYFPQSLVEIGDRAFFSCSNLQSVELPEGLSKLGSAVFANCSSVSNFSVPEGNSYWLVDEHGVLFNKDKTILLGSPSLKSVRYSIPSSVQIIDEYAFSCSEVKWLRLPSKLKEIKKSAFQFCFNLEDVTLPSSVERIKDWAFANCPKLNRVVIESVLLDSFDSEVFKNGPSSRVYILPFNKKEWGSSLKRDSIIWADMTYHISVKNEEFLPAWFNVKKYPTEHDKSAVFSVLPDYGYHFVQWGDGTWQTEKSVEMISDCKFSPIFISTRDTIDGIIYEVYPLKRYAVVYDYDNQYFDNLKNPSARYIELKSRISWNGYNFPIKEILPYVFSNCNSIRGVKIPDSVTIVGEAAFKGSLIQSISVPSSVKEIGYEAFAKCPLLHLCMPLDWQYTDPSVYFTRDYYDRLTFK